MHTDADAYAGTAARLCARVAAAAGETCGNKIHRYHTLYHYKTYLCMRLRTLLRQGVAPEAVAHQGEFVDLEWDRLQEARNYSFCVYVCGLRAHIPKSVLVVHVPIYSSVIMYTWYSVNMYTCGELLRSVHIHEVYIFI